MTKEVRFDIYCKHCEYMHEAASDDPCSSCLGTPSNGDSHIPINFHKIKPLINYLNEDPNIVGYTRDPDKSKNWTNGIPSPADLKQYFKLGDDGDYWETEA